MAGFKKLSVSSLMFIYIVISTWGPILASEKVPHIRNDEIFFTFFQLPDGEASLIQTGQGKNILINTGSRASEDNLLFQMEELNITTIDYLVLTKQSEDYCANANRLAERYQISRVVHTGNLNETCKNQVTDDLKEVTWGSNDVNQLSDDLFFKVLNAEASGEMSLGISYGDTSVMYLSNSDLEDEDELLTHNYKPEILKIGDYARGESPSEELLTQIDPHLGIVFHSKSGRPNEGLIERLNESWIDVYQLEEVGTTIIRMNLHDYEILS
ncbi:ComEC/Rec2 family competence protein [Radiobacillus sp. PE A8.2]|uniref:ComEC/Rec2 family competence protein n=1 Tax=Radiobacillus sp. PE A8.2 TaxID=3380349 RepID=UPI00388DEE1D